MSCISFALQCTLSLMSEYETFRLVSCKRSVGQGSIFDCSWRDATHMLTEVCLMEHNEALLLGRQLQVEGDRTSLYAQEVQKYGARIPV